MLKTKLFAALSVSIAGLLMPAAQAAVLAVDLQAPNPSGTISDGSNTVTFKFDKQNPSGTGVLDPFLRVQRNGTEQGYNTTQPNAGALPFEEKFGVWTHDVLFSSMTAVNGVYSFILDIGEPVSGTQSLLSLDGLRLYKVSAGGQNSKSVDANGDANGIVGTLLWDMDALADNYILLDANRNGNPGNGWSDMLMEVPTNVFAGVAATDYFILWSRFGLQERSNSGSESFGTFEEWALFTPGGSNGTNGTTGAAGNAPAPGSGSLVLLALGLMGAAFWKRKAGAAQA